MDNLSDVLSRLSISARVFYSGAMCGMSSFDEPDESYGHMHVLNKGRLQLVGPDRSVTEIAAPSLIFYARPTRHHFHTDPKVEAELVCATVEIGASAQNPIAMALPEVLVLPLDGVDMLKHSVQWLFDEAFAQHQARQPMIDRLSEVVVIQLLRYVIAEQKTSAGLLNALAHPGLGALMQDIHAEPERAWTVEEMASLAAMSRSKFADEFKKTLGQSPMDYLTDWRVSVAQVQLGKGKPVAWVANKVGYENSATLARVFKKKTGLSPRQWQQRRLS